MITDDIIESLVNCKYKAYLKVKGEEDTKKEYELMQNKLLESYKDRHTKNIELRYGNDSLLYSLNLEDVKRFRGIKFAVSPKLKTDKYDITFNFIKIIPSKFSDGVRSFVPILVSSKENFSKIEKLILCIKSIILSAVYDINYEYARIVYGSELKTIKFKIEKFVMEAKRLFDDLNKIINNETEPVIFQNNHCKICQFKERCYSKLKEEDSLALFSRVDENEIKKYNSNGIFTVNQLSYSFKPRKRSRRVKDIISPYYLSLQALAIRENKVYVHDKIDIPKSKVRVFVDMEGNSTGSSIYLIGIIIDNEGQELIHSLWADDEEQEIEIFRKFVHILKGLDSPQIYYYGKYETKVFRRISSLFNDNSIKELFEKKSTNVLKEIYRKIYFPTYSNSLKEIAGFFGVTWSGISSAIESVVLRDKWDNSKDDKIKKTLINYNKTDCIALKKVTNFLDSLLDKLNKSASSIKGSDVEFVDNLNPKKDDRKKFCEMDYVSDDIKVITKSAYFEYQRNKVYLKSNKRIKQIVNRCKSLKRLNLKVNKRIKVIGKKCKYCGNKNIGLRENDIYKTTIYDLKFFNFGIKRWIVQYITYRHYCKRCNKYFVPDSFQNIPYYSIRIGLRKKYTNRIQRGWGHNFLAYVVSNTVISKTSLRNLASNMNYYFKIPIDHQHLHGLKAIAAVYYKKTYKGILKKLLTSRLIHIDESRIKLIDHIGYIWVFTNMEEVYYMYRPTRESDFLDELLKEFKGILISDFYTGYDSIKCEKQKCLIHLIRDLNDTLLKNLSDFEVKDMVNQFGSLLRSIIDTTTKFGLKKRFLKKHNKDVKKFYKLLKSKAYASKSAEKLQKRLIKQENELFTFLNYDNIPWNNNNVEYAIKTCKDLLRPTMGLSTVNGLETTLIHLSIYQTCKYKGINFFDFLISGTKDIEKFETSLKK